MGETKIGHRPSAKTPALIKEICARISEGKSLATVCCDEDMPGLSTVWRWLSEDASFQDDYARAIQARAMAHAERIDDLAEKAVRGEIPADVARVAIDAKKWTASRLLPKLYGDKQQVEATVTHTHTLHLEALKELATRARGTQSGYIEGQATEIVERVAFPGESGPARQAVPLEPSAPVEPVPPAPPEGSGPIGGVGGGQTPPVPAAPGGRVRARQPRSVRTTRQDDQTPPPGGARPRGSWRKYKKEK